MADPTTTERVRPHHVRHDIDTQLERIRVQRAALKDKHAQALSKLMAAR